jgi:hypothetical protein
VERVEVVEQVEIVAFEEEYVGLRQTAAWACTIRVAAHRVDRGDLGQGLENGGVAYVAQVQNLVNSGQGLQYLGAQKAVGIT